MDTVPRAHPELGAYSAGFKAGVGVVVTVPRTLGVKLTRWEGEIRTSWMALFTVGVLAEMTLIRDATMMCQSWRLTAEPSDTKERESLG